MRAESILIELVMVVNDQPPLNREAHEWLASHALTELHEIENHGCEGIIGEFPTAAGLNLYHNVSAHFKTLLDAHYQAGQLHALDTNTQETQSNGRKKVHDNTDEQANDREIQRLESEGAFGAAKGRGASNRKAGRGRASKAKGTSAPS